MAGREQLRGGLGAERSGEVVALTGLAAELAELRQLPGMVLDGRTHITARNRRGLDLVPVAEVALFQADHKYVTAYHGDSECLLDETLRDLEQEFEGRFILQTQTDGPVNLIVVDLDAPDGLRGYARFDAERLADGRVDPDAPLT